MRDGAGHPAHQHCMATAPPEAVGCAGPTPQVHLAQQAYDLLEMHGIELERTLDVFEGDLRATGQLDGGASAALGDLADLYASQVRVGR
jgi:hypothetical protein